MHAFTLDLSALGPDQIPAAVVTAVTSRSPAEALVACTVVKGDVLLLVTDDRATGDAASPADELAKIKHLYDTGVLDGFEYRDAKAALIKRM